MSGLSEEVVEALRILSREERRGRYDAAPANQGSGERTAFQTLVACLVSQRVRDEQTAKICSELFRIAPTAEAMAGLEQGRLEEILRPIGFQRRKSEQLLRLACAVLESGGVPRTREGLMALPGIGPKCANIVLASSFDQPVIAVDTHVHRIANRLGWVCTSTPEKTEQALTPLVPVRWRRRVNGLLVAHGQLVCLPLHPRCGGCVLRERCAHGGVVTSAARRLS